MAVDESQNQHFVTTHWSVVLAAGQVDTARALSALEELSRTYWFPLYAYIRRRGHQPEDAQDFTQGFFLRLIEKQSLRQADSTRGKFRSFLLACLKNFLAKERERASAQRRGGGRQLFALDSADAETRYALEPADHLTPEAVFERRWAFAVLERTITELRREHTTLQKQELFAALQGFLPGGHGETCREELAAKRGVSVGAIDVAIHRLRQRFGVLLRRQVSQTVSSESEIEDEIRHLRAMLSG